MAIAEHEPGKLHAKNRGMLNMSHSQLHDFAKKPIRKTHKKRSKARSKKSAHRR